MSHYPHAYGYGQYRGQPLPNPYAFPNAPGYPAAGHNAQYNQSVAQMNRDASQAAYERNAIHIPGLGMGAPALPGTPQNHGPGVAPWSQPPGLPAAVPSAPASRVLAAAPPNLQGAQPSAQQVPPQPSSQPAAAPLSAADVEMEEGELSEGQFEDLYEPREYASEPSAQPVPKPPTLPTGDPSQPASAADTPDGGFYGTDEEDAGKDPKGNEARDRSASYSPFLSPREIQSGVPTPQPAADKPVPSSSGPPAGPSPNTAVPGLQSTKRTSEAACDNGSSAKGTETTSDAQKEPLAQVKSLQEAKKEAQKAILRLWPLGVKYQNYIDEGFDGNVIRGLFRDLHLDIPKATADSADDQQKGGQQGSGIDASKPSQPSKAHPQAATSTTAKNASGMSEAGKGEERKDRIARLLAAKAAKAPAVPPKPPVSIETKPKHDAPKGQSQVSAPTPPTSAPAKTKTWGKKERLIQQKIAALQKSREAQKSAAGAGAVTAGSNGTPVTLATTSSSPAPLAIPTGPRAASLPQTSAGVEGTPSEAWPPIPGLAISPNPQPITSTQRKRPVASDFVEYSTAAAPPKRPFGQPRQESSFIIDISDASDDEEMDMDMDMGSPVDESLPIRSNGSATQRGPTIRDFPPLTDTCSRQFSSPAPSVTPPSGRVNKRRETELGRKEKAIQEMRRKIALAEAKRKLKQFAGGSATPKQAGAPSEGRDTEASLLQPSESSSGSERSDRPSPQPTLELSANLPRAPGMSSPDPVHRAQRRGRLLSHELPQVESSLREKLRRLEQLRDERLRLRDEELRLQAEIDKSLNEQKRLADELQQLDTPAESLQQNGLPPNTDMDASSSSAAGHTDDQQEKELAVSPSGSAQAGSGSRGSASAPSTDESRRTGDVAVTEAARTQEQPQAEQLQTPSKDTEGSNAEPAGERAEVRPADVANDAPGPSASKQASRDAAEVTAGPDDGDASVAPPVVQPEQRDTPTITVPEQVDAAGADGTTPMELDSRSPSPEVAEPAGSSDAHPTDPLPDQISSVARPREAVQEMETAATGEAYHRPGPEPGSTLMPYTSPLRYFRAYRFHPEYRNAVAGGLKSLTYSNRIDAEKEFCPFELTGEQCPVNCEFQHFASIAPPDDQILLELGNPDDYSGEQKSRFIQGLRELLHKFKADKVKDFDTIARGIVEFRSQLLGDKYKVLQLDGVKI